MVLFQDFCISKKNSQFSKDAWTTSNMHHTVIIFHNQRHFFLLYILYCYICDIINTLTAGGYNQTGKAGWKVWFLFLCLVACDQTKLDSVKRSRRLEESSRREPCFNALDWLGRWRVIRASKYRSGCFDCSGWLLVVRTPCLLQLCWL